MSMSWHLTRQNVRASLHARGVLLKLMHVKWTVRKLKSAKMAEKDFDGDTRDKVRSLRSVIGGPEVLEDKSTTWLGL